ncbi:uncharacterized protein LOC134270955 [Saccostrea cucullata]|uniref:uncharacterized protein LOC134270955 n=1 Tax=Saccostrea cuccullata TaxID=36930 RepID=UPI002ED2D0EB
MKTQEGGCTVIQKRARENEYLSFVKTWDEHKNGFGTPENDTWIGDSMLDTGNSQYDLSGMYFSTPERDNDNAPHADCGLFTREDGGSTSATRPSLTVAGKKMSSGWPLVGVCDSHDCQNGTFETDESNSKDHTYKCFNGYVGNNHEAVLVKNFVLELNAYERLLFDSVINTGDPDKYDLLGMSFSTSDVNKDLSVGFYCTAGAKVGWVCRDCYSAFLNSPWSSTAWRDPGQLSSGLGRKCAKHMMIKRQ